MKSSPGTSHERELPRQFGFWAGLFVMAASMIGTGILVTSGYVMRDTGSAATLLVLWGLGGVLALAGALSIAEPAAALPKAGGEYVFIREAFGPMAAFVYGWATLFVGFAAPTAVAADAAVTFLFAPFQPLHWNRLTFLSAPSRTIELAVASVLIATFTLSHCLGHRESIWVQSASTLIKLLVLLILSIVALLFGKGSWESLLIISSPSEWNPLTVATGLVYVMYAYTGWNGIVYLAGEVRDPQRLLPRCLIAGCLLVTFVYMLVNVVFVYALEPESLAGLPDAEVKAVANLAAMRLFGPAATQVVSILAGLGMLATISAFMLTGPRVYYAMARTGLFPRYAGTLHPFRNVPAAATITQGAIAIVMLWLGTLRDLLEYAGVGLSLLSALVIATVFPLRRRTDLERPFRIPFYPFPPILFLAVTAWIVIGATLENPVPSLLGILSILAGAPLYWAVFGMKQRNNRM